MIVCESFRTKWPCQSHFVKPCVPPFCVFVCVLGWVWSVCQLASEQVSEGGRSPPQISWLPLPYTQHPSHGLTYSLATTSYLNIGVTLPKLSKLFKCWIFKVFSVGYLDLVNVGILACHRTPFHHRLKLPPVP